EKCRLPKKKKKKTEPKRETLQEMIENATRNMGAIPGRNHNKKIVTAEDDYPGKPELQQAKERELKDSGREISIHDNSTIHC
ncbi:hypothetical protein OS493_035106, partial [Desmophyllum pertusum]